MPQGALALTGHFDSDAPTLVRDVTPDGAVGPARDVGLGGYYAPGVLYVGGAPGSIAHGPDGTLVFPVGRTIVVRRADGTWQRIATGFPRSTSRVQAAASSDGRISVVAITHPQYGEAASYGGVSSAELRAGAARFSRPRAYPVRRLREQYTRHAPRPWAFIAAVAYDSRGQRVVGWIEDTFPDPGAEAEEAVGRAVAWIGGRRVTLDTRAAQLAFVARGDGVVALSDLGAWRSSLLGGGTRIPLAGPAGTPSSGTALATSPARTLLAWRGKPDGGISVAFLTG